MQAPPPDHPSDCICDRCVWARVRDQIGDPPPQRPEDDPYYDKFRRRRIERLLLMALWALGLALVLRMCWGTARAPLHRYREQKQQQAGETSA